jgi:pimeloyl-ACP methyl ester carboxylesterase
VKSTFTYRGITLEYMVFGSGSETVLCLHGFGREAEDFNLFLPLLKDHQRMVAINLLSHGNSVFPKERISRQPLSKTEWSELIAALLQALNTERFHLIGYSMGGRLAMVLAEQMADKILSLVLLAPDGLKVNLIYRFVSETKFGRVLYRSIIQNVNWLFRLVDLLSRLHLLDRKIQRFVHLQLETQEKRQLVYDAWLIHRKLFPMLPAVARNIESQGIPFSLLFGRYDKIIPARHGHRLLKHFSTPKNAVLLDLGHRLLQPGTARHLQDAAMWMPKGNR